MWIGLMAGGGAAVVGIVVVAGVLLKKTLGFNKEIKDITMRQRYNSC